MAQPCCFSDLRRQRLTIAGHHPSSQGHRPSYANLLTQYGTHGLLETVPTLGHTQSWPNGDQPRHQRIRAQLRLDPRGLRIQVKHPPHPGDQTG
ncbi:hypothetical protein D3C85_1632930 [compost metagenome]